MTSGILYIVSAPSGTGKTSLVRALVNSVDNLQVSISHTTRPSRNGEQSGVNYHFVDKPTFEHMLENGDFLEYAEVYGNLYGTSQNWVKQTLDRGIDVILEIDWQGAEQVRRIMQEAIAIYILPPSLEVLRERLVLRGQDDNEVIERRMQQAREEIAHYVEADYLVINDTFDAALAQLRHIILAQRFTVSRQQVLQLDLLEKLLS